MVIRSKACLYIRLQIDKNMMKTSLENISSKAMLSWPLLNVKPLLLIKCFEICLKFHLVLMMLRQARTRPKDPLSFLIMFFRKYEQKKW